MDDAINAALAGRDDPVTLRVRADTRAFAADVAAMRAALDGPLSDGATRAGRAIEGALLRAVRSGSLGFDDLRRVALSTMAEIARSAIASGVGAIVGGAGGAGGKAGGGGLAGLATSLLGAALGLPGRATGGPVSGGRGYLVGERGPELFVPTSAGRVEPLASGGAARNIRITINVGNGGGSGTGNDAQRMAPSARQIASAVRRAIDEGTR